MHLSLRGQQLKEIYIHTHLMVTTNQKSIIDYRTCTKMRKESKHNTKNSHQITSEESKRRRKKEKEIQKQPQNN